MEQKDNNFKIPGQGQEVGDNIAKLVKDLEAGSWAVGINTFARDGELAIRPKGQVSNTSDIGRIDMVQGFVELYGDQGVLQQFIQNYQF